MKEPLNDLERLDELAGLAREGGAVDLVLVAGIPPRVSLSSEVRPLTGRPCTEDDIKAVLRILYQNRVGRRGVLGNGALPSETEFVAELADVGRFRINVFRQRGTLSLVMRPIWRQVPALEDLGIPASLPPLLSSRRGLILVAGPSAAGKSTTLAAMVEYINLHYKRHIISVENPVEYPHIHARSIISQRSIPEDVPSYERAVRAALRQAPDIIVIGDMLNRETAEAALRAAESGHLVIAAVHTKDCIDGINRVLSFFPFEQRHQVQVQMANTLLAMLVQQLVPRRDDQGRVLATEMLLATAPIKHIIRTGQAYRVNTFLQSGRSLGMHTMEDSLADFAAAGVIEYGEALTATADVGLFFNLVRKARKRGAPAGAGGTVKGRDVGFGNLPAGAYGLNLKPEGTTFRSDFVAGNGSHMSGTGFWWVEGGVLQYLPDNLYGALYAQIADYSILLGQRTPFVLSNHVRVICRGSPGRGAGEDTPSWGRIWVLVLDTEERVHSIPAQYEQGYPLRLDGAWQTIYLQVPEETRGVIVKAYAVRFSEPRTSYEIRDILFS